MKNRYTPTYPSFTIQNLGLRGYASHGQVFLMLEGSVCFSKTKITNSSFKFLLNIPRLKTFAENIEFLLNCI